MARHATTFSEARVAARQFQGRTLTNAESGIQATVSRNALDKMLSRKAVGKSESPSSHAQAVANLDQLFERATLGWSKPDRQRATDISAVHRFFVPMQVNGRARIVKMTVKETAQTGQSNPLYTVESVELNEKTPAASWVDATVRSDGIDPTFHPLCEGCLESSPARGGLQRTNRRSLFS